MPTILLRTEIQADISIVFDLSRSIDLHKISTKDTNEQAVAGKISGLIELNESVTWRAKHFGVYQNLTSKITEYDSPNYFVDEMQQGVFKQFKHEHKFVAVKEGTRMTDVFEYESPLGFIGKLADALFLKKYMIALLIKRNRTIKVYAESDEWRKIIAE
jgi:ligand-binding SRPBCC domain-containing protein